MAETQYNGALNSSILNNSVLYNSVLNNITEQLFLSTGTPVQSMTSDSDEEDLLAEEEEDVCARLIIDEEYDIVLLLLLFSAIIMYIVLTFTEKREERCSVCCKGGGVLLSVNFLENKTSRSMIVAAFVLATVEILETIKEFGEAGPMPKILKVLYRSALVGVLNFFYLPLFHCVSENTLLRQCLGLLYAILLTCWSLANTTSVCAISELPTDRLLVQVTEYIVVIAAGTFLVYKFLYRIVRIARRKFVKSLPPPITKDPYQMQYIKNLLRKQPNIVVVGNQSKLAHRFQRIIYVNTPGFRYSITILTSITIGALFFLIMIASILGEAIDDYRGMALLIDLHRSELNATMPNIVVEVIRLVQGDKVEDTLKLVTIAEFLDTQLTVFAMAFFVATAGAITQICCTVASMLHAYRSNVISMYRRQFDDTVIQNTDNVSLVVSAVSFAGYQVAHMIWGYILQLGLFFGLFLLFTEIIIIPVLFGYWGVIYSIINWVIPFILILVLTKGIQRLLVKYAFLVDRGKMFGIQNRKCFYNMMFFMFFYNIFTGLIACVLRVVKATILGVWFFPRLDKSIFPHRFEAVDAGYRAYMCLLRLEERQNNVILLTFVQLLSDQYCKQTDGEKTEDVNMEERKPLATNAPRSKRARNRWFLAYTLINNKTLQRPRWETPIINDFQTF